MMKEDDAKFRISKFEYFFGILLMSYMVIHISDSQQLLQIALVPLKALLKWLLWLLVGYCLLEMLCLGYEIKLFMSATCSHHRVPAYSRIGGSHIESID